MPIGRTSIIWKKGAARGVQDLVVKYGLPDHDYLMSGISAGGVWVHRLALHKPQRFLAVYMHVADSYDAPTPEGQRILWLLTTGEQDAGYGKARRFYKASMDLGYPIIFKAFVGLGHADSPDAEQLEASFFDYALSLKANPSEVDASVQSKPIINPTGFTNPLYYGDMMNQCIFPSEHKDLIPAGFRVPLPTQAIANAWNR